MLRSIIPLLVMAISSAHAAEDGFVSLFNGKDLTGWEGNPASWSVEDGAITGVTKDGDPLPYNQFLIWRGGTLKNFELHAKIRQAGNNTGIQYRSQEMKEVGPWSIGGYQCDIHPTLQNNGMLYDERGRGIVAQNGQSVIIDAQGVKWLTESRDPVNVDGTQWNEYAVIAQGHHLTHKINGQVTVDIIDLQSGENELDGLLAFQIHRGPGMKVQIKDVMLKVLPDGEGDKEVKIPADAKKMEPPAKPGAKGKGKGKAGDSKKTAAAPPASAPAAPMTTSPDAPKWIWSQHKADAGTQTVRFRKAIKLSVPLNSVTFTGAADDSLKLFIDGKEIVSHSSWKKPVVKEITSAFTGSGDSRGKGIHVLALEGANTGKSAAAVLASFEFKQANGETMKVVTDGSWQTTEETVADWASAAKPAGTWAKAKVIAPLGGGPWKGVSVQQVTAAAKGTEPTATPVAQMKIKDGFKVELLYSVPNDKEGSWVAMTIDDKGRLIASDQNGSLYRITPPAIGGPASDTKIEKLNIEMGYANGLLWAFDSLYVMVCNEKVFQGSGVYRLTDTNGDDQPDKVEQLRKIDGQADHGPHALILSPDGKSITVVCGNNTTMPEMNDSRVPRIWKEDEVLPRIYGRGFMRTVGPPGGFIAKMSPDGKHWELQAMGFRNEYDAAYNREGDLFTYDADMEWDMNTPWYRPTRVCLAASGAEFGWRNCSAKFRAYYPDNLPGVINVGPGSPTGVIFGYGTKFPAKYQDALFICDWSYGKLYAAHLKPQGSAYTGELEEIVAAQPLPLTDLVVRPQDGALYFAIGGRKAQSGLYRLTYVGKDSTAPSQTKLAEGADLRALRRQLESYHGKLDPAAVDLAFHYIGHEDRFIRFAARTALEHQPLAQWAERALSIEDPTGAIQGALAVARVADASWQPRILESLARLESAKLDESQAVDSLRVLGVCLSRMGDPDSATCEDIARHLIAPYPTGSSKIDYELCQLLVRLKSSGVVAKTVPLLLNAPTQEEQIAYAMCLRSVADGWTPALREDYFKWLNRARSYKGGASFSLFINEIRDAAIATLTEAEKVALKPILDAPVENTAPQFTFTPHAFVKNYTVAELAPEVEKLIQSGGRDFARGRNLFGTTTCYACHRFNDEGGAVGPDLSSVGGRFGVRDLLESIIEPSKVISDQFEAIVVTKIDGTQVVGRIANLSGDSVRVMTNMMNPSEMEGVDRRLVKSIEPSPVSMMPPGLINVLKPDEIADLLAYLISGGNPKAAMFAR